MGQRRKEQRHEALQETLALHPFYTDQELAGQFGVSVSTIRLDRTQLGIPELRERNRVVAHEAYGTLKALGQQELIGELMELEIGKQARSKLVITENMVLSKARVARGHYLFAQANSLAIALVDAEVALTGSVELKFTRPVHLSECVIAEGRVSQQKENKYWVEVKAQVGGERVLEGKWLLFAMDAF